MPGMHLREIIPNKESLITRAYWNNHNALGFTAFETFAPGAKPAINTVSDPASDINWTYAVLERQNPQTMATDLLPFNLGKLILQNDDTQNLELLPADIVTIFTQSDIRVPQAQQSRFVRLEGEFNASGIYEVKPGETLAELIQRTGGLTPMAYLFGAEFLRESTRQEQIQRKEKLVRDIEVELQERSTNTTNAAINSAEASQLAAARANQTRLLEELRSVQPTGRIVLNVEPGSNDITPLNLALENGDRFVVPARPATVNVFGSVYNENALVQQASLRVADYVAETGGPTRNADKAREFIIRANGLVVPKTAFSTFGKTFESTHLNPGDSVVVPPNLFKGEFFRQFADYTQVFSQLALGAAIISILK